MGTVSTLSQVLIGLLSHGPDTQDPAPAVVSDHSVAGRERAERLQRTRDLTNASGAGRVSLANCLLDGLTVRELVEIAHIWPADADEALLTTVLPPDQASPRHNTQNLLLSLLGAGHPVEQGHEVAGRTNRQFWDGLELGEERLIEECRTCAGLDHVLSPGEAQEVSQVLGGVDRQYLLGEVQVGDLQAHHRRAAGGFDVVDR